MSNARSQKSTQEKIMKPLKPYKMYQNQSFKKSHYTQILESKITCIKILDLTYQKLVNTTLQILSKLNPVSPIVEIDYLLDTIPSIGNIKEVIGTIKLVNLKLKNLLNPKNDVQKLYTTTQKFIDENILHTILYSFKDSTPDKFFKIFHSLSLLSYTTDFVTNSRVNILLEMGEYFKTTNHGEYNLVIDYIKKNSQFFTYNSSDITHLYPYGGGKQKFYETINHHFQSIVEKSKVDRVIDPFMGGTGSFYSLFNIIHNKKETMSVILNDINPSIYKLCKHVQQTKSHHKMMFYISNIIQTMYLEFQSIVPSVENYKIFYKNLLRKLNHIESNRTSKNTIEGSSILLFLLNSGFGGNYEMKNNVSYLSSSTDLTKVKRYFSFVGKIELYHYLFTSVNVKFENKDYTQILKKYSSHENTFTTIDPPYFETNTMSIEEFDSKVKILKKKIQSHPLESKESRILQKELDNLSCGCSYNYGECGNSFPHEKLLKNLRLIKGELNYFNYEHPIIKKYSKKFNLNINYLERKTTNGKSIEGGNETKTEVFMTGKPSTKPLLKGGNHNVINNITYTNYSQNVS